MSSYSNVRRRDRVVVATIISAITSVVLITPCAAADRSAPGGPPTIASRNNKESKDLLLPVSQRLGELFQGRREVSASYTIHGNIITEAGFWGTHASGRAVPAASATHPFAATVACSAGASKIFIRRNEYVWHVDSEKYIPRVQTLRYDNGAFELFDEFPDSLTFEADSPSRNAVRQRPSVRAQLDENVHHAFVNDLTLWPLYLDAGFFPAVRGVGDSLAFDGGALARTIGASGSVDDELHVGDVTICGMESFLTTRNGCVEVNVECAGARVAYWIELHDSEVVSWSVETIYGNGAVMRATLESERLMTDVDTLLAESIITDADINYVGGQLLVSGVRSKSQSEGQVVVALQVLGCIFLVFGVMVGIYGAERVQGVFRSGGTPCRARQWCIAGAALSAGVMMCIFGVSQVRACDLSCQTSLNFGFTSTLACWPPVNRTSMTYAIPQSRGAAWGPNDDASLVPTDNTVSGVGSSNLATGGCNGQPGFCVFNADTDPVVTGVPFTEDLNVCE